MLYIILIVIVLVIGYIVYTYNEMVKLRNMVKEQWSQIDVLLKRRSDLIPNLVEVVKGYVEHESNTLEEVVNARNKMMNVQSKEEEIEVVKEMSNSLTKLLAIAESYPELKANTNYLNLQENLQETEDKISYARQFYNDAVLKYKNMLEVIPGNMIASLFKFESEPFFEASDRERDVPKIKF